MATLILGTVGRAIGGPIGGLFGTLLGGTIDRGLFGGGKTREGPRLANLAVQSAAYGEPLPRLYGRMRVAGNLVWTAGIKETRGRTGSSKNGTATNTYSYSSSFAVIVAGRAIVRVERIWADGKLLRAADGTLNFPATIRTYPGSEGQPVDPLIAAAEGVGLAPAYRGRAYVVFENLPLADYGNRIPNLTFEVVADDAAVGVGDIAVDLAPMLTTQGGLPAVTGFAAAEAGTMRQALATLATFADLTLRDDGTTLAVGSAPAARPIRAVDLGAAERDGPAVDLRQTRAADAGVPDALWFAYADLARDYQTGIQSATRRTPTLHLEQHDLAVAGSAADVKLLADQALRRAIAGRTTGQLTTAWRHADLRPGDVVTAGDDPKPWRVVHLTISGGVVDFDLVRLAATDAAAPAAADPGRVYVGNDAPQGPTILDVLDIPALPGPLPGGPQLLIAAGGVSPHWRRADILLSRDRGGSYAVAATATAPAAIGTAVTALAAGTTVQWDRRSSLDVTLAHDDGSLQSATEDAVLAGANLALVGDEIVQFASATALGPGRFRLAQLLRGRRGSEAAVTGHVAGERFVLLDDRVVTVALPAEAIGASLLLKAVGPADDPAGVAAQAVVPRGVALRPLSPATVTALLLGTGDYQLNWCRRSRAGFAWSDGVDAPLGEDGERYRVTVRRGDLVVRELDVAAAAWTYAAADHAVDAAGGIPLAVTVAQISAAVGPGGGTTIVLTP